mgnify:CR=1 FL=1
MIYLSSSAIKKDKIGDVLDWCKNNAIKNVECFSKAGSGIVFCNGAGDFTLLGKN